MSPVRIWFWALVPILLVLGFILTFFYFPIESRKMEPIQQNLALIFKNWSSDFER